MFLTARQLELMLRDAGAIVLPLGAKLTPAAQDLVRARKLDVRFDVGIGVEASPRLAAKPAAPASDVGALQYLWWCGVQSGTAKAALAMSSREANLQEIPLFADAAQTATAVRQLIDAVKAGTAAGGILVVEHSGLAALLANRSPYLRAIVGTGIAAIDAGLRDVEANVLIIEPGSVPLLVLKNMISKFIRGSRAPSEALVRQLSEVGQM